MFVVTKTVILTQLFTVKRKQVSASTREQVNLTDV